MPYCVAKHCNVSDRNNPRKAHFHRIPSTKDRSALARQWLAKCARPPRGDPQARVCSEHFVYPDDYQNAMRYETGFTKTLLLKPGAVPSIFNEPLTARIPEVRSGVPETSAVKSIATVSTKGSGSIAKHTTEEAKNQDLTGTRKRQLRSEERSRKRLLQELLADEPQPGPSNEPENVDPTEIDVPQEEINISGNEVSDTEMLEAAYMHNEYTEDESQLHPAMTLESEHCSWCANSPHIPSKSVLHTDASTQTGEEETIDSSGKDHCYAKTIVPAEEDQDQTERSLAFVGVSEITEGSTCSAQESVGHVNPTERKSPGWEIISDVSEEMQGKNMMEAEERADSDYVPDISSQSSSTFDSDMSEDGNLDITGTVPENVADQRKFMVFEFCLLELFAKCQKPGCTAEVKELKKVLLGSRLVVKTRCAFGCSFVWSSQPILNKMGAGNLLLSAAILFSGNTYARMHDIANCLNMPILSESQFFDIQKKYLFPVVNETWISTQLSVLDVLKQDDHVVMSGDGRCDSPGHSAKYGTYTLMESKHGLIVEFSVLSIADPNVKNSYAMETMGLRQCLNKMTENAINVSILATDRHVTIKKIMRAEYPSVIHQFDIWHVVKSITKKLIKACGRKKACASLQPWIPSITNHFWWSAQTCEGNAELLKEKWQSVIYHTVNVHSWSDKNMFHACGHPPLRDRDQEEIAWLKVGSASHDALVRIVKDQSLTKDLAHCTQYCHTGQLEVYHSFMLKYVPKRQHFSYEGMVCRTQLAAIDHNCHAGRLQAITKKGEPRYNVVFPKVFGSNKNWIAKTMKERKDYSYRENMMKDVVLMRTHGLEKQRVTLPPVKANIASVTRPKKSQVVKKSAHYSRFQCKDNE